MTPHSSTKETFFKMVYDVDAMIPIEVDTTTGGQEHFTEEGITSKVFTCPFKILAKYLTPYHPLIIHDWLNDLLRFIDFLYIKKIKHHQLERGS